MEIIKERIVDWYGGIVNKCSVEEAMAIPIPIPIPILKSSSPASEELQ